MENHDLVVIGKGPGDHSAAIRAAQQVTKVTRVEKEPVRTFDAPVRLMGNS